MSIQKKKSYFLIATLIIATPVFSQVNFASVQITSFAGPGKKSVNKSPAYIAAPGSFGDPFHSFLTTSSTGSSGKRTNTKKGKKYYRVPTFSKRNIPFTPEDNNEVTKKEVVKKSEEISFNPTSFMYPENSKSDVGITEFPADQLRLYAKALKQYAIKNGYDTGYAFLSNMGILANRKRFFVMNLVTMEIEQSGLVSHGRGRGASIFDKKYSNQAGSKCTALGRYKISGKYKGGYGESYRMVGLDSSNQNALERNIVLHPMDCVPDNDGTAPACVSDGCPAVSVNFFTSLKKIIDSRKKPLLLWIFDSNLDEAVLEEQPLKNEPAHPDMALDKYHSCSLHNGDKFQVNELP